MKLALPKILSFYLKQSKEIVILAILIGIFSGGISVLLMALISITIANPEGIGNEVFLDFAMLAALDLGAALVTGLVTNYLSQNTSYNMRMRLCRQILATPLQRIEETGSTRIVSVMSQDISTITEAFLQLPQVCIHLAVIFGCLAFLGWLSPTLLVYLVVIMVLAILSIKIPEGRVKRYLKLSREAWDTLANHLNALTEGAKELKLHQNRRMTFISKFFQPVAISLKSNNLAYGKFFAVINAWSQVLYFIVISLILFIMPGFGGIYDRQVLIGYAITILFMRGHIVVLMNVIPSYSRANISLRKVEELGLSLTAFNSKEEKENEPGQLDNLKRIELIGVTHTYYRELEDGHFVLGPVNLFLEPGELVFLVGGNGSGKTTLGKVLTGLYPPESGAILFNGEQVTNENRDRYRQYFSAIFSDFYIFEQLMGLEVPDLDVHARGYLNKLQLDRKVEISDGKLSTIKLSLGQRKRLALLTAYLEDRPIYVFDEWASGQDPMFKEVFYLQILPELKARGKTVVVISHDDRYYNIADRILKLEEGRLTSFDHAVANA